MFFFLHPNPVIVASTCEAWRLPNTYIVGYWGRIFANGEEQETSWRSDTLQPGARVGLMVLDGGLIVFVNGEVVVRADGLLGSPRGPFYPVVDVFAATRMITLNKNCRHREHEVSKMRGGRLENRDKFSDVECDGTQ